MAREGFRPSQTLLISPPTTADLRRENLGSLLRLVHRGRPTTRAAITETMGLSRNTVGVLLDVLVGAGLLLERPPAPAGTRGRPSPIIDTVPARASVLALDVAADAVRLAVVGLGGHVLAREEWAHDAQRSADAGVSTLLSRLADMARRRRRAGAQFQAVGVACWGIVRNADGFIYAAPNVGWHDVPLGAALRERLGEARVGRPLVQSITVANDADLGAVAEFRRGAGVGAHRLLYVHSNTGVGGGIIDDGRLLAANGAYAGEIGHMTVNPGGIRCRCGAIGCWETEVDERALIRAAGVRGDLDGPAAKAAVARVLSDAAGGERGALAAVQRVSAALGAGLASLVHILGPDRIVLGGYLAELADLTPGEIRQPLRERGFSPEAREVSIRPATYRDDAALLGAAEHGFEALFTDPLAALT